jgi:hypothetical protein
MHHTNSRSRKSGWNCRVFGPIFILVLCLSGCSDAGSPSPQNQYQGLGSIAFSIQWPDIFKEPDAQNSARTMSDTCDNYGVATVEFIVYDEKDAVLASKTFACQAGTGTVVGIAAGSNRTLVIWADDINGNTLYGAQVSGIEIIANQVHDVGAIGLEAFPYQAGSIRIENASTDTIYTVNISHCTVDIWGWNQISTPIGPSASSEISEIPSGCYDVRICTVSDPSDDTYCSSFLEVDVTVGATLSLTFTGT